MLSRLPLEFRSNLRKMNGELHPHARREAHESSNPANSIPGGDLPCLLLPSRASSASFGLGSRPRASLARRSRLVTSTKRSSSSTSDTPVVRSSISSQYKPDLSGGEDPKGEAASPFQDLRTPGRRLHPSGVSWETSERDETRGRFSVTFRCCMLS